jgi:hypothetical protein
MILIVIPYLWSLAHVFSPLGYCSSVYKVVVCRFRTLIVLRDLNRASKKFLYLPCLFRIPVTHRVVISLPGFCLPTQVPKQE